MNIRNLPASALLVVFGAGAILFIGAFARFDQAGTLQTAPNPRPLTQDDPPAMAQAQPSLPANLSPGLSELIKLAQAHVDEGIILAYITNSHLVFAPTADQILYLSDLGLSQDVIGALVATVPPGAATQPPPPQIAAAPAPAPFHALALAPAVAAQPESAEPVESEPDTSAGMFYNDLAPYGAWSQQPDYGMVWQPTVETINEDWSPYVDAGQWLYSDSGWYWQSDYTWGWAVFHYGRWTNIPRRGWVWQPGNVWAPAWVGWRSSDSFIGWAPLPPGTGLNVLGQLTYRGKPAGPKATFNLPARAYTFVNISNLMSRNLPRRAAPPEKARALERSSVVIDSYAIVNNRIFNGGESPEAVASARRRAVPQIALRSVASPDAAGLAQDRKTLGVYVPAAALPSASLAAQSEADTARPQAVGENLHTQEQGALAENDATATAPVPAESDSAAVPAQLPPLRYPSSPAPQLTRREQANITGEFAPNSMPARRVWPRGYAAAEIARPATPAPPFGRFNPAVQPSEPPRFAVESHPAPVENHPAPVEYRPPPAEPVHVAPAAPPPSSSSSKSGK